MYTKSLTALLVLLTSFFIACGPIRDPGIEEIKVVKVISSTEIEVMRDGTVEIIVLAGIKTPSQEDIQRYISEGSLSENDKKQVLYQLKLAQNQLSSLISPGDVVYARQITGNQDWARMKEFIVYGSDLNSLNETMVSMGYAFPTEKTGDTDFDVTLDNAATKALRFKRGLWMLRKINSN